MPKRENFVFSPWSVEGRLVGWLVGAGCVAAGRGCPRCDPLPPRPGAGGLHQLATQIEILIEFRTA